MSAQMAQMQSAQMQSAQMQSDRSVNNSILPGKYLSAMIYSKGVTAMRDLFGAGFTMVAGKIDLWQRRLDSSTLLTATIKSIEHNCDIPSGAVSVIIEYENS